MRKIGFKKYSKKVLSIFLAVLITFFTVMPGLTAFASTSSATEITSNYLFEQSTLDKLELNFNSFPKVTVTGNGSARYTIQDMDTTGVPGGNDPVENRMLTFQTTSGSPSLARQTHFPNLKVVALFENCGMLDGKNIDIQITYSDFYTSPHQTDRYDMEVLYWTAYGTPEQQNSSNEWWINGFSKLNMDIQIKYHGQSSPITLQNAYFTLYSMDGSHDEDYHYTHSEAAASLTASNVYWYKTRQLSYNSSFTQQGYTVQNIYFGNASHTQGNRDTKNALCFQYENQNSINLDMIICFGLWSEGYHVNFTPLTAVIPDAPTKSVTVDKATAGTQLDFEIKQEMPKSFDSNFVLNAFVISDKLDQYLTYRSAVLYDQTGKDITDAAGNLLYLGTVSNQVSYIFDSDFLDAADYNGQTFTLEISTVLKDDIPVETLTNSAYTMFNSTVTLTTNEVDVDIYYPVTSKYVDTNGTPLSADVVQNIYVGDEYNTSSKDIPNYQLSEISGDETGTVSDHAITVTYIYEPADTSVNVNYLNEQREKIADSETINGHVFDQYSTAAKEIYGYELIEMPSNASGTMTQSPITVDYIYKLKNAKVVVKWVDEEGKDLTPSETITGKVFDPYETQAKDFYGYRLSSTPANASGTMTEDDITVVYIYTQKQASVTANYLNEQNEVLSDPVIVTGNVGDSYSTNSKEIYGYTLKEVQGESSGRFTEEDTVVNYIYELKDASVLVNYKDENNEPLTDSITIEGKVFDIYNTENKTFYGYELSAIPSNASGTMTEGQTVVDYVYRLKNTSVLVNYVNEDFQPIAESETINGKVFDSYTTIPKTIYGYELTATPSNSEGEMTENQIVVNYVYRLKDSSVFINYINEDGKQIAESVTIDGKVGQTYTSDSKEIYGYELTAIPENATGIFSEEQTIVNYVYRLKDSSVIVNYVDENQKPLDDSVTLSGKVFDPYTTEAKEFYGYTLTMTPDNASGQFVENQIVVNYVYALKDASVTVKYVDEHNTPLTNDITINGQVFDEYSTENKTFYGYTLTKTPDNASGTMTEEPITVVYVYSLNDTSVIVNYVDDQGNNLTNSVILTGKVFDPYTTEQKEFYGYTLTDIPDNASGQMSDEQTVVNYVYMLKDSSVLVNYVTDEGQQLTDPIILTGKVFDDYSTESKEFYGYTLTATPESANGKFSEDQITINYIYTLKKSSVVVNYVDEHGNQISDPDTVNGHVFDIYETNAKTIYGYVLTAIPDNASGRMGEDPITVTYIYKRAKSEITINYLDENNQIIETSENITGFVGDPYSTSEKEIYGYELIKTPNNANGVYTEDPITINYIYRLKDTSVVVYYVDEDGNTLAQNIIINGKVFDRYETTAENIDGYTLTATPDNASGEMTEDQIIVRYVYTQNPIPVKPVETGIPNIIYFLGVITLIVTVILASKKQKETK